MRNILAIENITELHRLLDVNPPTNSLVSIIYHKDYPSLESYKLISKQWYRMEFYSIIYKSNMEGSMQYGRNRYDFKKGSLIFTAPGQIMTPSTFQINDSDNDGWSLFFHLSLLQNSELASKIDNYHFFSYDVCESLHVSQEENLELQPLVRGIESESNSEKKLHSNNILTTYIDLLLNYSQRFYDRQFDCRYKLHNDIISQFNLLLKDYYNKEEPKIMGLPSVKYCADQLCLSSGYLGDLLKKETGIGAQEHIHRHIIDRAKHLLLYSNRPINQIAFDLGFEYHSHFSKLFKLKTGDSPSQFRKERFGQEN